VGSSSARHGEVEEFLQAVEALLDRLAVDTEHRDMTRLEAFRELLVDLLDDNGQRFDWTADESKREWMRQAIEGIDRRLADDS
jgi:hypothetical protein